MAAGAAYDHFNSLMVRLKVPLGGSFVTSTQISIP